MNREVQIEAPRWMRIDEIAGRWSAETGEDREALQQRLVEWFAGYILKNDPAELDAAEGAGGVLVDESRYLHRELVVAYCADYGIEEPDFWKEASAQKAGPRLADPKSFVTEAKRILSAVRSQVGRKLAGLGGNFVRQSEKSGRLSGLLQRLRRLRQERPLLASRSLAAVFVLLLGLAVFSLGDKEDGNGGQEVALLQEPAAETPAEPLSEPATSSQDTEPLQEPTTPAATEAPQVTEPAPETAEAAVAEEAAQTANQTAKFEAPEAASAAAASGTADAATAEAPAPERSAAAEEKASDEAFWIPEPPPVLETPDEAAQRVAAANGATPMAAEAPSLAEEAAVGGTAEQEPAQEKPSAGKLVVLREAAPVRVAPVAEIARAASLERAPESDPADPAGTVPSLTAPDGMVAALPDEDASSQEMAQLGPATAALPTPENAPEAAAADISVTATDDGDSAQDRILVFLIKQQLAAAGFDPGVMTGDRDPEFYIAIQAYQEARGLPAVGQPTEQLLIHLVEDHMDRYGTPGPGAGALADSMVPNGSASDVQVTAGPSAAEKPAEPSAPAADEDLTAEQPDTDTADAIAAADVVAEEMLTEATAAEETAAEETAAEETAAEETVAEETAAEATVAEATVAEATVAEETAVEETVAEETVAEETVAEETVAEETVAEETLPEATVPPAEPDEVALSTDPDASPQDPPGQESVPSDGISAERTGSDSSQLAAADERSAESAVVAEAKPAGQDQATVTQGSDAQPTDAPVADNQVPEVADNEVETTDAPTQLAALPVEDEEPGADRGSVAVGAAQAAVPDDTELSDRSSGSASEMAPVIEDGLRLSESQVAALLGAAALAPSKRSLIASGVGIVVVLQQQLKDAGYDPGPLDGDFGPRTARAIAAYQNDHGLTVDGKASLALLDHLEIRALQLQAVEASANGDPATAVLAYSKVIRLRPDDSNAYFNRGLAFKNAGLYERAIADYDRALSLDTGHGKALYDRANVFYHQGDYGRALEDYLSALTAWFSAQ